MNKDVIRILYYIINKNKKSEALTSYKEVGELFKAHNLEPFLWYALKQGLIVSDEKEKQEVNLLHQTAIFKATIQEEEFKLIKEALKKEKILFLPLKGFIIRDAYPSFEMRSMADIDILVQPRDLKKIKSIMKSLNYEVFSQGGNHDVYMKKPCMNVEMHRDMIDESIRLSKYYKDIWKKTINLENSSEHSLSLEDNYLYIIAHSAKHYETGGMGIRFVLDIYFYLKKYKKLDRNYISYELEKMNLKEYENKITSLASNWFDKLVFEKDDEIMAKYIYESGIYGRIDNKVQAALAKDDSEKSIGAKKRRYFFKQAFPSFKEMKRKYPSLRIWFIFLPFYYIHRIVKAVFRGHAIEEVKQLKKIDESQIKKHQEIKEKTMEEKDEKVF